MSKDDKCNGTRKYKLGIMYTDLAEEMKGMMSQMENPPGKNFTSKFSLFD